MDIKKKREKQAIVNIKDQLSSFNESILVWPTGMGKTYLSIVQVALNMRLPNKFTNLFYLSPLSGINENTKSKYSDELSHLNTKFLTFAALRNLHKTGDNLCHVFDEFNTSDTLFVIDECHQACSNKTLKAISLLKEICSNARFLGITATPVRGDGKNPIIDIFHGHIADNYTIRDAIRDGIFPKPQYICGTFEFSDEFLQRKVDLLERIDDQPESIRESLTAKIQSISQMDTEEVLKKYLPKTDYLKLIIFFPTKSYLNEKISYYEETFKKLYPDYEINILKIYSGIKFEEDDSIEDKLDRLQYKKNRIDIIAGINMMSMCYHLNDLNTIIMDRCTTSQIVYSQQIGRCFDITKKDIPLIFDFVGNCNRKQYFTSNSGRTSDNDKVLGDDLLFDKDSIIFHDERIDFNEIEGLLEKYEVTAINGFNINQVLSQYKKGLVTKDFLVDLLNITGEEFDARLLIYEEKIKEETNEK